MAHLLMGEWHICLLGQRQKSSDMCVGRINFKSVGNDSGLVVVASVLL